MISVQKKYEELVKSDSRYLNWYLQLCESRSILDRKKGDGNYYESHHIVPKWMGGSDKKENRVLLTAREHYLAHYFLFLHFRDKPSSAAFHKMNNTINSDYRDSKKYEELRKYQSEVWSGEKNPAKRPEIRKKISDKVKGEKNGMYGRVGELNPFYGKKPPAWFKSYKQELHGTKLIYKGVEYPSIREAERQTGVSRYLIKKNCKIIK